MQRLSDISIRAGGSAIAEEAFRRMQGDVVAASDTSFARPRASGLRSRQMSLMPN
jgi:hypothetical protein